MNEEKQIYTDLDPSLEVEKLEVNTQGSNHKSSAPVGQGPTNPIGYRQLLPSKEIILVTIVIAVGILLISAAIYSLR
jgi:hypothetical protein